MICCGTGVDEHESEYCAIIKKCPEHVKNSTKKTAPLFDLNGRVTAAKIFQCYDADSAYMTIDLHGRATTFKCRTQHIDGAEMKTRDPVEKKLAIAARDRVRDLVDGRICCVRCFKNDKYGRVLVDIFTETGANLAQVLLREKLVFPYEGKTKNHAWAELYKQRSIFLQNSSSTDLHTAAATTSER